MTRNVPCAASLLMAVLAICGCGSGNFTTAAGDEGTATPPTLTAIDPPGGGLSGGTMITLAGSGFLGGSAVVHIDGAPAMDTHVWSDTTLTVRAPPGTPGAADVMVSTDSGNATMDGAFTYMQPSILYAADGKRGVPGSLYTVDIDFGTTPPTVTTNEVGDRGIGFAITGMAVAPDGMIYGTEATQNGKLGDSHLVEINPLTGEGVAVGLLEDIDDLSVHNSIADITFLGDRLIGWSQSGDIPVEIDTATGVVTEVPVDALDLSVSGSGLAADAWGALYLTPGRNDGGGIYTIDLDTELATFETLVGDVVDGLGNTVVNGRISAMTMSDGTLYGVVNNNKGIAPPRSSTLVSIDPATGHVTTIGPLPDSVDGFTGERP